MSSRDSKHSLSLALGHHFLPLDGEVTWPLASPKPVLDLPETGGRVSLTVAESNADFSGLSGIGTAVFCEAGELHPLLPDLPASRERAAVLAFQVTLFADHRFSFGTACETVG